MDEHYSDLEPEDFTAEAIDMGAGEGDAAGPVAQLAADAALEADQFGRVFRQLRKRAMPLLRHASRMGARAVLGGGLPLGEDEAEDEDFLDGFAGGDGFSDFEDESDFESEGDLEDEDESVPGLSAEDDAIAEGCVLCSGTTEAEPEPVQASEPKTGMRVSRCHSSRPWRYRRRASRRRCRRRSPTTLSAARSLFGAFSSMPFRDRRG